MLASLVCVCGCFVIGAACTSCTVCVCVRAPEPWRFVTSRHCRVIKTVMAQRLCESPGLADTTQDPALSGGLAATVTLYLLRLPAKRFASGCESVYVFDAYHSE